MRTRRGRVWTTTCIAVVVAIGFLLVQTAPPPVSAQPNCSDLVVNGGFENNTGWVAGPSAVPPQYVTTQAHTGSRSLMLGIPPGVPNQRSFSSVRQLVSIPSTADSATLRFWYLAQLPGPPDADYAEFVVMASDGTTPLSQPWRGFVSNGVWNEVSVNLSGYRGLPIQIYFNVVNDGVGQTAVLYLDDVSLVACGGTIVPPATVTRSPSPYPLPTITPSSTYIQPTPVPPTPVPPTSVPPTYVAPTYVPPTLPPPPGPTYTAQPQPLPPVLPPFPNCVDAVVNGSFEAGLANWYAPPDRIPAQLVYTQARGGALAVQLGSQDTNINSYSSIRQLVQIPAGYPGVWFEFWTWTWAGAPGGADRQEADFLAPNLQVLQKFWRVLSNDRTWVQHVFPVNNYAGRSVQVYLNAYNDGAGAPAGMYVDEVHIWACNPSGAQPYSYSQPQTAPQTAAQAAPQLTPETQGPVIVVPTGVQASQTAPLAPVPVAPLQETPLPPATVPVAPANPITSPTPLLLATLPANAVTATQIAGPPTITPAPALTPMAAVTANVTVLSLLVTPTSTPFAPPVAGPVITIQASPGTRNPVAVVVVAPTATPRVGTLQQIAQSLHLPPGWPLGLLGIIVILLLLILVLRSR